MKVLIVGAKIHSGFASDQFSYVFDFIGFVQAKFGSSYFLTGKIYVNMKAYKTHTL